MGLFVPIFPDPLAGVVFIVESIRRPLFGVSWTEIVSADVVLPLWPALGAIDITSVVLLLTLAALCAWTAVMDERFPGCARP
jgi:hypothetical protein